MTQPPCITIRADADPAMGTGHLMRCLALAQAAQDAGLPVHLAGRANVPWLLERLEREDIPFGALPGSVPKREAPEDLLTQVEGAGQGWIVLDGYHFGPNCHKALRSAGYKLLVIDDYNHLPDYHCDILLNQNIGAQNFDYRGNIGQKLLGPGYALLRREFLESRNRAAKRSVPEKARNILLSLGGGDCKEVLSRLAGELSLPELADCTLNVIAGKMPPETIADILKDCPAKVHILSGVDDMPELMLRTDLCITAGGSTCWELCCLGVPFLTVEVAENQRRICDGLDESGMAPRFSAPALAQALLSADLRASRSLRTGRLVDGCGSLRCLSVILDKNYFLRPPEPEDSEAIWRLAASADVRAVSCSSAPIPREDHERWFSARLGEAWPLFLLVADSEDGFLGYIRFTLEQNEAVVSIALKKNARGRGIGRAALGDACRLFRFYYPERPLKAVVLTDNAASLAIFHANAFSVAGQKNIDGRLFFVLQTVLGQG